MQAVMKGSAVPIVEVVDGVPTLLSTNVAAVFEKRNDNVIRDIEEILRTLPEDRKGNFIETQIERPQQPWTRNDKEQGLSADPRWFHVSCHGLHRRESR